MFISNWEDDDEGILPGDHSQPHEQFLLAAEEGDLNRLKEMYSQNPNFLSARDRDFYTPLHRAAYNNQSEVVEWLLSVGADPELRTEYGWTPLHSAACWAKHDTVKILLSHGVDVNCRSNGNATPLHLAINSMEELQDQILTIQHLLSVPNIDARVVSNGGETPLMLARGASKPVLELVEEFLSKH